MICDLQATCGIDLFGPKKHIGDWGVSPNREISMAPVSVMPRLGFWSSISAPRAAVVFFAFVRLVAMCKGFKETM